MNSKITLEQIQKARKAIENIIDKTNLLESIKLSNYTNSNVYLKCENLQKTGSFKVRGACNKIANLTEEEKSKGVIAASAGNHAQGVALGAKMSGIKATIVMPSTAPLSKISATKSYGAEVVLEGEVYDDAYAKSVSIQKETGATFLHPFNDKDVIAGQGTISLEIFEQLKDVDTILCPIGGGGIISGVATAAKALNPNVKIIGVQTSNIPSMYESLKNGKVTSAFNAKSVADGISVVTPGEITFNIVKEFVDEIVLVEEDEIAEAILFLIENQKLVSEGSGAVTVAALLNKKYIPKKDENVVCIISGGNVDVNTIYRIIGVALAKQGRRYSFTAILDDKPGGLSKLSSIISENNANILNLNQTSLSSGGYMREQSVEFILETLDYDHIEKIKKEIKEAGFKIVES